MKKISIILLKSILSIFILVVAFVVTSYIHLSIIRSKDLKIQNKRLDKIDSYYDNDKSYNYLENSEEDLDLIPYNETRFLASHNSYKKKGSIIGKLFVGLGDSFSEAKALNYSYKNLTEQLQNGIYSFELDLRYRKDKFEVTHVPIVDNSSTTVSFSNGLEEIKTYLDKSENSFPILVILEIKNDFMWLDPFIKDIKDDEFIKLENLLIDTLGDKLYKPSDMIENYDSLIDRINDKGWPLVSKLKGKVMFVIHAGGYANNYLNLKQNNEQVLFSATYKDSRKDNAPFIIHNDLDVLSINELVSLGYMVRTRIGETLSYTENDLNMAMASNAQILTSDFTVARSDLKEYLYLKDKYTIIRR